jgi:L-alanine-DL-glutamate epimerase-like enolase superfamily enzyme
VDEAIRRARLYTPLNIAWLEEPLPADDLGGHMRLSGSTTVSVAVGESMYSLSQSREYLQRGACSIVQPDVARIGGITPWLKVAHLAESFNVPVCPHFLMELHVSLTAAVPNGRYVEYIPQLDDLTLERTQMQDGRATPSSEPGLGIAWDCDRINRQRIDDATRLVPS